MQNNKRQFANSSGSNKPNIDMSTPPHNIEAEQAVIASILIDAKSIDDIYGMISPEDFYHPSNAYIFATLLDIHRESKPIDMVTLSSKLVDIDGVDKAGGLEYISNLMQIIPNAGNIIAYANTIREKSLLRKLIHAGSNITELGFNKIDSVEALVDEAQSIVYKLSENKTSSDINRIDKILTTHYADLEELYKRDDINKNLSGVTSGYKDLDDITNGFQNSDLIIIAGRPGMGKTSFGLNMMYNSAVGGKSAIFFSLEMPIRQLTNRIISAEAEINYKHLRTGGFNEKDWDKMAEFSAKLSKLDIYLDDTPGITVNQIRSKCRRLKQRGNLDIIFIDYLQIMGYDKSITVREQQISEISRSLKALAKELNVPIVAFAQVNRAVEHRTDAKPFLSDLRESGAIEQDADIIMFIYRDAVYNKDSIYKNVAEITVAKHRNGETGVVYLSFNEQFTQFGKMPIDKTYIQDAKKSAKSRKKE